MSRAYYNRNDALENVCQRCEGNPLKDSATGLSVTCPACKGESLTLNKYGEEFLEFLERCVDRIKKRNSGNDFFAGDDGA